MSLAAACAGQAFKLGDLYDRPQGQLPPCAGSWVIPNLRARSPNTKPNRPQSAHAMMEARDDAAPGWAWNRR